MIRLCLAGGSVQTSPSAAMHRALLEACGIEGVYELRSLDTPALEGFVQELRAGRYRGCNVTMPHKQALAARCDRLEGDAAVLGVVNTIVVEQGSLAGDNTDAAGFALGLEAHDLTPVSGGAALVLGAGGAAAAVVLALSRAGVAPIRVAARRPEQVSRLRERLPGARVEAIPWSAQTVTASAADAVIVVNATPLHATDLPLDVHSLPPSCTVADVRYRPYPVELVEAALAAGRPACDGREMLVQQALRSFQRWTGVLPDAQPARRVLRELLEA